MQLKDKVKQLGKNVDTQILETVNEKSKYSDTYSRVFQPDSAIEAQDVEKQFVKQKKMAGVIKSDDVRVAQLLS